MSEPQYIDARGQIVREGDIVAWSPSEGNGMDLRRVVSIVPRASTHYAWVDVKACKLGDEERPAGHRVIRHANTLRWPDQSARS